jgi:hypothetical protein
VLKKVKIKVSVLLYIFGVEIPAGARDFLFPKTSQTSSEDHPVSYSMGAGFRSRGV